MIYVLDFCFQQTKEDELKFLIAKKNGMISDKYVDGFEKSDVPRFLKGSALFDTLEDVNWFVYNALMKFGIYFFITKLEEVKVD